MGYRRIQILIEKIIWKQLQEFVCYKLQQDFVLNKLLGTRRWVLDEVLRKLPIWGTNFLQPSTAASCKHHDPASHCATCQSLHGLRGSVPELKVNSCTRNISNKGDDFTHQDCTRTFFLFFVFRSMVKYMIRSICWKTGNRLQAKILSSRDL